MKNLLNRLVTSSADPKKYSLAVKGIVLTGGAFVVQAASTACGLGLYCIGVDSEFVNDFAGIVETMVFGALIVVGSLASLAGLARKFNNGRWAAPRE